MKEVSPDGMLRNYFSLLNDNDHEEIEKLKSESKKFRSVVESYMRPFYEWKPVKIVKIDNKKGIESVIERIEEALKSYESKIKFVLNSLYVIPQESNSDISINKMLSKLIEGIETLPKRYKRIKEEENSIYAKYANTPDVLAICKSIILDYKGGKLERAQIDIEFMIGKILNIWLYTQYLNSYSLTSEINVLVLKVGLNDLDYIRDNLLKLQQNRYGHKTLDFMRCKYGIYFSKLLDDNKMETLFLQEVDELGSSEFPLSVKNDIFLWAAKRTNDILLLSDILRDDALRISSPTNIYRDIIKTKVYSSNLDLEKAKKHSRLALDKLEQNPDDENAYFMPFLMTVLGKQDEAIAEVYNRKDSSIRSERILNHLFIGDVYFLRKNLSKATLNYLESVDNVTQFPSENPNYVMYCYYRLSLIAVDMRIYYKDIFSVSIDSMTLIYSHSTHAGLIELCNGYKYMNDENHRAALKELKKVLDYKYDLQFPAMHHIQDPIDNKDLFFYSKSLKMAARLLIAEILMKENKFSEALMYEYEVLEQDPNHFHALSRTAFLLRNLPGAGRSHLSFERRSAKYKHNFEKLWGFSDKIKRESLNQFRLFPEDMDIAKFYSANEDLLSVLELIISRIESDSVVLIEGETGTGKEVLTRAIHKKVFEGEKKPFVPINCSAIPEKLVESELFGHVKGAFTGATRDKKGAFQSANGGTLFLDEIGEMPLNTQKKLLRAIQEKKVKRVGTEEEEPVNFLLVSATNKDLIAEVEAGNFREDLYYRICGGSPIKIPPLRERKDDIDLLFNVIAAKRLGDKISKITEGAKQRLREHPFRGNVREIENLIEQIKKTAPPIVNSAVMDNLLSGRNLLDMTKQFTLDVDTRELIRKWRSTDFGSKKKLVSIMNDKSGDKLSPHTLNRMITAALLDIGQNAGWSDLEAYINLAKNECTISDSHINKFIDCVNAHLKKVQSVVKEKTIDKLLADKRWIYKEDKEKLQRFIANPPRWIK